MSIKHPKGRKKQSWDPEGRRSNQVRTCALEGNTEEAGITPFLGSEESEPCFRHPIPGAQHWKDRSLGRFESR